jgi:hypothetical protein
MAMAKPLSETHPDIAADWDAEANGELTPNDVAAPSKIRVAWKCPVGHQYSVSIYTRVRTNGCKFFHRGALAESVRRAKLAKSISFAQAHPDLVARWDASKNQLHPSSVSVRSKVKIWWRCESGHEWLTTPQARSIGQGCPTCEVLSRGARIRADRLRKGGKSFADTYPELLAEWDYDRNTLLPTEISPKSNIRASWKCKFGHEWEASVTNRSHNMSGCPYCTNQTSRLEIFVLCELRSVFDLVEWRKKFDGVECDIFIPSASIGIEVYGEYWHREKMDADLRKNHFLESCGVTVIRVRDSRIPTLPGRQVKFSPSQRPIEIFMALLNVVQDIYPSEIIAEYLEKGVQRRETDYRAMIARLPAPPEGSTLSDLFPTIADEWDFDGNLPLTPDLFAPGAEQKVAWICKHGHRWNATIKNRTKRDSGCPVCYRSQQSELTTKRFREG